MQYEHAKNSVLGWVGSDLARDIDDAQFDKLVQKLTYTVRDLGIVISPEAVNVHAEQLFPELFEEEPQQHHRVVPPRGRKQTREEILAVCAKFFNADANHPEKKTYWEAVCPFNPPPITQQATVGSEINRKIFFAEVDKHVAAGRPIRLDVLTDIAVYLSRMDQLERYPAPVEVVPPPPPPSPQELAREKAKKVVAMERSLNDSSKSPIRGAQETAKPLVEDKPVLTEEQRVALNEQKRADDAVIAEAQHRIQTFTGRNHARTYSGRAELVEVFKASMDEGAGAKEVLRRVDAKIDQLAGNNSIR